ncbi:zinc-dependent alcohol dehydrogenase [Yinghuangia seranimata]|uniref:zinc-dependent alcohol dehydrogenase n=1 Tax=Yinghuangia seranimata TaxID=408067 RepID=UPI00248D19AA|nr:zinc-binding dehydrogenase [Yinghuangia seranimata]MDI2127526.1 zinc-binding dehydrogenase [Yinghuangia seranimata]
MVQHARAAVFPGDGTYEIREFAVPDPPPGGAVLRVEAVGLCGSDAMQLHGQRHVPGEVADVVPGHEIVGVVHAITAEAAANWGVAEGDRVCVDEIVTCGRCRACLGGPGGLCANLQLYGYTMGADHDGGLWGGYGEFMRLLPTTHLMKAPDGLTAAELTVFEPLANALNWVAAAGVRTGDRVVVQGPGHQGLLCAAAALAQGASQVIVTGTGADGTRLATALELGAHAVVDVDAEDVTERVGELTGGRMASVVMDLTPVPAAVNTALQLAAFRGRVALAGLKHFRPVENLLSDLVSLKSLTVHGCAGSTPGSMEQAVQLLADRPSIARTLRGVHVGLEDVGRGIALLERAVPGEDAVHVSLVHEHSVR